jgi:hypothetical protein
MSQTRPGSSRRLGQAALLATAGSVVLAGSLAVTSGSGGGRHKNFQDYINGLNSADHPKHFRSGIFFGTGEYPDKAYPNLAELEANGEWFNPMTGEPFDPARDRRFFFGTPNVGLLPFEAPRIVADHLGAMVLTDQGQLKGHSFDYIICHSNGCTNAFRALNAGLIRAGYVFAMGSDSSAAGLVGGNVGGAKVIHFVVKGDPIPKLKPIEPDAVGESFGIRFRFPFGRGSGERVVMLEPKQDLEGGPFRHHALAKSYLPLVRAYMDRDDSDPIRSEVRAFLEESKDHDREGHKAEIDDRKIRHESDNDCPPECPPNDTAPPPPGEGPSGPGGGGGGGQFPKNPPGGAGRGGVLVQIPVDEKSFAHPPEGKR